MALTELRKLMKFLKTNNEIILLDELKYYLKINRTENTLNNLLDSFITIYASDLIEIGYLKEYKIRYISIKLMHEI